jgi:hypothetical protein
MKQRALIECNVGDGMFEGEKVVSFNNAEGKTVSAIVDENRVQGNALVVDIEVKKSDRVLVAIPGESFSTRKVWVGTTGLRCDTQ